MMGYCLLSVGWGTAELLGTKVIPLWVGARGVEFRWINLQTALDANMNLVSCCKSCERIVKVASGRKGEQVRGQGGK